MAGKVHLSTRKQEEGQPLMTAPAIRLLRELRFGVRVDPKGIGLSDAVSVLVTLRKHDQSIFSFTVHNFII